MQNSIKPVGFFKEIPSASVGRLWEQQGDTVQPHDVSLYEEDDVQKLCDEINRLQKIIEDKLDASTLLTGVNIGPSGIDVGLEGGAVGLMVEMFAKQFKESGAINYLEMQFSSKVIMPGVNFVATIQMCEGKTPHQLRVEAEKSLEDLKKITNESPFRTKGFESI